MQNSFAPIILFVYNRPEHTLKTLENLSKCDLAEESVLYIFADGAKTNASEAQKANILKVRNVIYQKKWCKTVIIEERKENKGLAKSVREGVSEVIKKHGKAIVLEDDLEVSIGFLKYMNQALNCYNQSENVWGVSGFGHPLHDYNLPENSFFLPIPCSWGWATWARVWEKFENTTDNQIFTALNENMITQKDYDFGSYYFYDILKAQFEGKVDSWAAMFHATMYLNRGYFLFPKYSLVKNIGFDALGTHTHEDDFFSKNIKIDYIDVIKCEVTESLATNSVRKAFEKKFGKKSLLRRILGKLKRILGA